ncbi:MAG: hypothetical protein AB8B86_17435 [Pseudomonadales bacterium]
MKSSKREHSEKRGSQKILENVNFDLIATASLDKVERTVLNQSSSERSDLVAQ